MVSARLIGRDNEFYIYEYRPEDGDIVGRFGVTEDLSNVVEYPIPEMDYVRYYIKRAIQAMYVLQLKTGKMPKKSFTNFSIMHPINCKNRPCSRDGFLFSG